MDVGRSHGKLSRWEQGGWSWGIEAGFVDHGVLIWADLEKSPEIT